MEPEQPKEVILFLIVFAAPILLGMAGVIISPAVGPLFGPQGEWRIREWSFRLITIWGWIGIAVAAIGAPLLYGQEGLWVTAATMLGIVLLSGVRWLVSKI
jgi:hypothetical protein